MRTRTLALLSIVLISLVMVPQFDAAPGGIGSAGDNGCSCHGGPSSDTVVSVSPAEPIPPGAASNCGTITNEISTIDSKARVLVRINSHLLLSSLQYQHRNTLYRSQSGIQHQHSQSSLNDQVHNIQHIEC